MDVLVLATDAVAAATGARSPFELAWLAAMACTTAVTVTAFVLRTSCARGRAALALSLAAAVSKPAGLACLARGLANTAVISARSTLHAAVRASSRLELPGTTHFTAPRVTARAASMLRATLAVRVTGLALGLAFVILESTGGTEGARRRSRSFGKTASCTMRTPVSATCALVPPCGTLAARTTTAQSAAGVKETLLAIVIAFQARNRALARGIHASGTRDAAMGTCASLKATSRALLARLLTHLVLKHACGTAVAVRLARDRLELAKIAGIAHGRVAHSHFELARGAWCALAVGGGGRSRQLAVASGARFDWCAYAVVV